MNQSFLHTTLYLTAYGPPGSALNHAYFALCLLLYAATLGANALLVALILGDPNLLPKPVYTLLLHLSLNGVMGSCAVCPKVMQSLMSRRPPSVSYGGCLTQVVFVNVYASCAYAILAAMAYDRYVAVCEPLRYVIGKICVGSSVFL